MCLIRDLALALSACLYQALCTSDAWSLQQQQQEQQRGSVGPLAQLAVVFRAMHNIPGDSYMRNKDEDHLKPSSVPSKWPGIYFKLSMDYLFYFIFFNDDWIESHNSDF